MVHGPIVFAWGSSVDSSPAGVSLSGGGPFLSTIWTRVKVQSSSHSIESSCWGAFVLFLDEYDEYMMMRMMMMPGRGEKASERAGSLISRLHPAPLAPPLTTHHRLHRLVFIVLSSSSPLAPPLTTHHRFHRLVFIFSIGTTNIIMVNPHIIVVITTGVTIIVFIITIGPGEAVRLTVTHHVACFSVYEALFNWLYSTDSF